MDNTMIKLIATTAALAMASATSAFAGGMAEPVMDAKVVEDATSSASQQIIIPLLLLLVIIAAAASPDSPGP
jgi:hypothetical protein